MNKGIMIFENDTLFIGGFTEEKWNQYKNAHAHIVNYWRDVFNVLRIYKDRYKKWREIMGKAMCCFDVPEEALK